MILALIILFFSVWFLINTLYVFNRKSVGKLGKWLHRYAWINEWSMFTNQDLEGGRYRLVICDFNSEERTFEWKALDSNQLGRFGMFLNPNFILDFFINKCIKKMYASNRLLEENDVNIEVFEYLCSVVREFPNTANAQFRKIKIEKRTERNTWEESICSEAIEL